MMTPEQFDREVAIIRQPPDPPGHSRREALERLRMAAFDPSDDGFPRMKYQQLLQELALDADEIMRRAAISDLASQKDEIIQKRLLDGLSGDAPPLVPDEWALQLLAYDTHRAFVDIYRRFADDRDKRESVRIEAIRGLGGDHASAERLARMMADKTEPAAIRLWSGLSLRALAPPMFARLASQLIKGPADATSGDVRNMCEVALRTSPTLKDYL